MPYAKQRQSEAMRSAGMGRASHNVLLHRSHNFRAESEPLTRNVDVEFDTQLARETKQGVNGRTDITGLQPCNRPVSPSRCIAREAPGLERLVAEHGGVASLLRRIGFGPARVERLTGLLLRPTWTEPGGDAKTPRCRATRAEL
jgi:hypothetical protein